MTTKSLQLTGGLAALGAFAAAMSTAGNASAAPCPVFDKTVVIVGSSAVSAFILPLGNALLTHLAENGDPDPINVLYQSPGSCTGATFVVSPASTGTTTGTVTYYDGTTTAPTCELAAATKVDIGISDVFASSCGFDSLPNKVKDFRGPVQSMAFAVSTQSSQQVMSAEAAYLSLGVGDTSGDFQFNDSTKVWVRDQSSGTQQMVAHAINVPANAFISTHSTNAAGIIAGLQASSSDADVAAQTFGILGMDAIRGNTANDIVPLAYQHYGQSCGFWPSTTQTALDMQNTRDGHYFIQGPVHMFTKVGNDGHPANANAKILIDYLTGAVEPSFDLIALEAAKSIVPDCAMRVTRDDEAAPFMSYMPALSCECKWLDAIGADLPEACTTCDDDSNCTDSARPKCHYGFCEVQ